MTPTERNAIATMDHHAKLANLPTWSELKAKVDAGNGKTAEPAPLDLTKPCVTKAGYPATFLGKLSEGTPNETLVWKVTRPDYGDIVHMTPPDGVDSIDGYCVINVKTEPKVVQECYANLYPDRIGALSTDPHDIKRVRGFVCIGTIKLTLFDDGNVTVEKVEV